MGEVGGWTERKVVRRGEEFGKSNPPGMSCMKPVKIKIKST